MAGFPITQGQLEDHLRDRGFLTNLTIEAHLEQAEYITAAKMRQWYNLRTELDGMCVSTRLQVEQTVADENAKFTALREAMQTLLDSTQALSAKFSGQVATATSEFAEKHATTLAELLARDEQLRDYVNKTQQGNQQTFELLSAQLASVGDDSSANSSRR